MNLRKLLEKSCKTPFLFSDINIYFTIAIFYISHTIVIGEQDMKKISNRYESNFRYMYFEFWVSLICVIKYLSKTWHTHDFRNQVLCLLYASLSKEAQFTKLPLSFHSWSFFKIKSLASCWKETTIYREGADFNKSKYWKHWHHHMSINLPWNHFYLH